MAATGVIERLMPSRFPNGMGNVASRDNFGMLGEPDPTRYHNYMNDFDRYSAGEWTVTTVGTTPTAALTNADGGRLLLTTTGASGDGIFLQKVGESFSMETGKPTWFKTRFQVSDASLTTFAVGLQVTDTTPLDVTDGIYFLKASGSTALQAMVRKNATTGSISNTNIGTLVSATDIVLGWYYDGKAEVSFFINDAKVATLDGTSAYLPDTTLTPSFGIQTGTAAVRTASYDYIAAIKYRGSART